MEEYMRCKCPHCTKKFRSIGAMEMHVGDKHPVQAQAALKVAAKAHKASGRSAAFPVFCAAFLGTAFALGASALIQRVDVPAAKASLTAFQQAALR
jgi:hypothetical protein